MASGGAPVGTNSAYSSRAPTPSASKASRSGSAAPSAAATAPSRRLSVAASRPASAPARAPLTPWNNRARICWQALSTAEHTLAVLLEPPETDAGGRLVSPVSTVTALSGTPSCSAAICPATVRTPVPISCDADCTNLPVCAETHSRGGRAHVGGIYRGGAAQTDQPVPAAHRTRARVALTPAKRLRTLLVAFLQLAAAEGFALDRLALGVVAQSQLHRIHAERIGELIHGALQREHVRQLGRGAHERRRLPVSLDDAHLARHRRIAVHAGRGLSAGHRVVVQARSELPGIVTECPDPAVTLRTQTDAVTGGGPVRLGGEPLGAAHHTAHRPVEALRGEGHDGGARRYRSLRAEAAADEMTEH